MVERENVDGICIRIWRIIVDHKIWNFHNWICFCAHCPMGCLTLQLQSPFSHITFLNLPIFVPDESGAVMHCLLHWRVGGQRSLEANNEWDCLAVGHFTGHTRHHSIRIAFFRAVITRYLAISQQDAIAPGDKFKVDFVAVSAVQVAQVVGDKSLTVRAECFIHQRDGQGLRITLEGFTLLDNIAPSRHLIAVTPEIRRHIALLL